VHSPRLSGVFACAALLTAVSNPAWSAVPDSLCAPCCEPSLVVGQPPRWRLALGGLAGYTANLDVPQGRFFIDAEDRMAMPQFGLLDMNLEGAVDFQPGGIGTAIGAYAKLPYLRVGIERDLDAGRFDVLLSAQGSARRGGLFQHGERMRLDWSPTARRVQIGFMFNTPWTRYRATRPFGMAVDLPRGQPPAPIAADASRAAAFELARVDHAIEWLDRLLTPHLAPGGFSSDKGRQVFVRGLDQLLAHQREPGHGFAGEDSAYHAGLELAFAQAAGGDAALGRELARDAESAILDEVVLPFNRLFARPRRPKGVAGLSPLAQARFDGIVHRREPPLDAPTCAAASEVFRRVVLRIDAAAQAGLKRWGDTSLAWLPLNYGLRPEQYDSQGEIEDVLGRLVGEPFTHTNAIRYVLNDQFYYQLQNTIRQTQHYHVLWIHDFRGRNSHRGRDRVAWSQAIGGYIEALTEAIEGMDRGERGERAELPVFMVFLDQHYYEVNKSPSLMHFLQHLSTAEPLDLGDAALSDRLARALARLQAAVRNSPTLRQRGDDYVRRHVCVQILITYPLDPAFAGDILMRDHRKLAFYDATESDPTAGGGLFTGEGVGEHYQGPLWEDRSLMIQGPEVLRLKTAARQLLLNQGFRPGEIPQCLRQDPDGPAAGVAEAPGRPGWTAHLLTAINETGWGSKSATALKAAIYNLMPAGSAMIAPDSLWTSDFWAGMFVAAAMRGCRVYVIAPTQKNAPSNALPTMGLMHETLSVLFAAAQRMVPDLARSGGALHVGLYTRTTDVSDMRSQVEAVLAAAGRGPGMFPRLGLHPECIRALRAEYDTLQSQYAGPVHPFGVEEGGRPKIHMKAQFFASAEGLGILGRREWGPILARYLALRRRQTLAPDHDLEGITTTLLAEQGAGVVATHDVYTAHCDSLRAIDPRLGERIVFLATVGSHNQDRRSMLLDGEVLEAISGSGALTMAIDFAFLVSTATWPQSAAELDAQFPETSSTTEQFFHWMRNLI